MQNGSTGEAKYGGDDDVAEAAGGPKVIEKFIDAHVGIVPGRGELVPLMYAKVDNGKSEWYKFGIGRSNALNIPY